MNRLATILQKAELSILIITAFLFPIAVLPISPNPFIVGKLFILLTGLILVTTLHFIRVIITGKLELRVGNFDAPLLLLCFTTLISTLLRSPNKMEAILLPGTTTAILTGFFFYFIVNQYEKRYQYHVKVSLIASGILATLWTILNFTGILQRVPFLPDYLKTSQLSLDGGFLPLMIFFIIILLNTFDVLFTKTNNIKRALFAAALGLLLCGFGLSIFQQLPGKPTTPHLLGFSPSWIIAVESIKVNPLLGVGPGNYITAYNRFRPLSMNATTLWQNKFTSARSFYLSYITETGLLGTIALFVLFITLFRIFKKELHAFSRARIQHTFRLLSLLLLIGLFALFPATPLLIVLLFFLFSSAATHRTITVPLTVHTEGTFFISRLPYFILLLPLATGLIWISIYMMGIFAAEFTFQKGLSALAQNEINTGYNHLLSAIQLNPRVDRYHLTLSQVDIYLIRALVEKSEVSDQDRATITQLIQQAIAEGKSAVAVNPERASTWANLTSIYQSIRPLTRGADQFATQTARQAIALDQFNPQLHIVLGGLYYTVQDFDRAIQSFQLAVALKPDYANAHYNLAFALQGKGEYDLAIAEIQTVLSLLNPGSPDYQATEKTLAEFKAKKEASVTSQKDLTVPEKDTAPLLEPPVELPADAQPPEEEIPVEESASPSALLLPSTSPESTP